MVQFTIYHIVAELRRREHARRVRLDKQPVARHNAPAQNQAAGHSNERDPWATDSDAAPSSDDDDLRAIVKLANTDRSMRVSADWKSIEKPLAPYGALLRGVDHE
jgi:hypothetical protein